MLSLKLVRSLVFGDTINTKPFLSNQTHTNHDNSNPITTDLHHINQNQKPRKKNSAPTLIFLPTNEIITDTYRICTIARDMGMNLHPNPSLSHIIFSWPPSTTPTPSLWSSTSSSSSTWSLSTDFVPLPFPSLTHASITHLQCFVSLSKGLFKLGFCRIKKPQSVIESNNHWNCSSLSLFSTVSGEKIESMEGFFRVLGGMGWTMLRTSNAQSLVSRSGKAICVYLFRKIDCGRGRGGDGGFRIRELRLPTLDFRNAPLRILQYILLMTDNIFYLA